MTCSRLSDRGPRPSATVTMPAEAGSDGRTSVQPTSVGFAAVAEDFNPRPRKRSLGRPYLLLALTALFAVACAIGPVLAATGRGDGASRNDARIDRIVGRFDTFAAVPDDPRGRIAYGTERGKVHLIENVGGRYREVWVSQTMDARVREVIISDLFGTGEYAIIAYTVRGDIQITDIDSRSQLWRAPDTEFASIEKLITAQVDFDPQLELIFLSEGRLYIYDGRDFLEQWRSNVIYDATDLAVGDVDGDGEPEIVLTSGHVLDGKSGNIEWESVEEFGDYLGLADVDGDGKDEIIGGTVETTTIWDADQRREKWD